jgi:enterochelin esterase-like enzyme
MSKQTRIVLPELDDQAEQGISEKDLALHSRSRTLEEPYELSVDAKEQDGVPKGTLTKFSWGNSSIYPGTERDYWIYVPKQYDHNEPASLMVFQDGEMYLNPDDINTTVVLDNLIHKGDIPVIIGLFVNPGDKGPGLPLWGGTDNRSVEYDSLDDKYAEFLIKELIPEVEKEYTITQDPEGRAICGISSGGICAFTVAWNHPDVFNKVVSHCGSFTNIRGGHHYSSLVRRTARKPLRVFLQSGANDLEVVFGNWFVANQDMASALEYRGYDHQFVHGTGGHTLKHGGSIFPETLRWLWRDHK